MTDREEAARYFFQAYEYVTDHGFAQEVDWARSLSFEKQTPETFFQEYVWVVLNSGMREQVAREIYREFMEHRDLSKIGHPGKREAIAFVMADKDRLFEIIKDADNKLAEIDGLPYIGKITKYHLAKNLGLDVCKPDRHLVRLAERFHYPSPQALCEDLAKEFSERVAVVDQILWRYCNLQEGWVV